MAARPFGVVGGAGLPEGPEVAPPSRTVRSLLGARLRALRKEAKLTAAQVVARGAASSEAVLSRIETGKPNVTINHDVVNRLLSCYEVTDADERRAVKMRVEEVISGRDQRWRSPDGVVAGDFADLLYMEAAAERITGWESMYVPGLLQTTAYMDAVLAHPCLTEQEREHLDRRRRVRRERQQLLESKDRPEFTAILDEAVLHRTVGSREVMREQLRHLFSLSENRTSIHIRIFPSEAWEKALPMTPSLTLLQFSKAHGAPDMLYAETAGHGGSWLKEERVEMVKASLEQVRSHALNKQDTLRFLDQRIGRLADPL